MSDVPAPEHAQTDTTKKPCVPCGKKVAPVVASVEGAQQEQPSQSENPLAVVVSFIPTKANVIEIVDRRTGLHAAVISRNINQFYSCSADTSEQLTGTSHTVRGAKVLLLKNPSELAQHVPPGEVIDVGVVNKVGDLSENVAILNSYGVQKLIVYASDEVLAAFLQANMEWTVTASFELFWALTRNPAALAKEPASLRQKIADAKSTLLSFFS